MAPKVTYSDGTTPKICIIGTGYSGLCTAIRLKTSLDITSFTIIEKNQDVGGVWFSNTYPGAACDIPAHYYQLSFCRKADWKAFYPAQGEIQQYMKDVTKKYDLYPHIQFNTTVKSATWSESEQKWIVIVVRNDKGNKDEETLKFDIVICGTGVFRQPNHPPEYMSFKGPIMHSAEWDSSVRLENKVVGVVGGAASAMQVVPAIARRTKELIVFQRTASWQFPRLFEMRFFLMRIILTIFPFLVWVIRFCGFLGTEYFYATHRQGSIVNYVSAQMCKAWIFMNMRDWKLARKFIPTHKYGYKAVLFSNRYHRTFNLPNVKLNGSIVTKVVDRTITTEDGQSKEIDVLVLCTGFKVQDFFAPMQIIGKGGIDVLKEWHRDRPRTYYGICAHESPNLFFLVGPNSVAGHTSALFLIECQAQFIIESIKTMLKRNAQVIQLKVSAQNECMADISDKYKDLTWSQDEENQARTWIYNDRGQVTTYWPKTSFNYWRKTRRVNPDKFHFKPKRCSNSNMKIENMV